MRSHRRALIHVTQPERADGVALIQVEGDLYAADTDRFRHSLALAAGAGPRGVVIDVRGCRFLDPECASVLPEAADDLQQRTGASLQVVTSAESVLDMALGEAWRSKLWVRHTVGAALARAKSA